MRVWYKFTNLHCKIFLLIKFISLAPHKFSKFLIFIASFRSILTSGHPTGTPKNSVSQRGNFGSVRKLDHAASDKFSVKNRKQQIAAILVFLAVLTLDLLQCTGDEFCKICMYLTWIHCQDSWKASSQFQICLKSIVSMLFEWKYNVLFEQFHAFSSRSFWDMIDFIYDIKRLRFRGKIPFLYIINMGCCCIFLYKTPQNTRNWSSKGI